MQHPLNTHIQHFFEIPDEHIEKITALFVPETLEARTYFCVPGKSVPSLSFIKNGHLRIYSITEEGKDVTQWLSSPGEFITDLSALVFGTPCRWYIEALSDCELYSISKSDYAAIGRIVPSWDLIEKRFIAKCFVQLENRIFSFQSHTAEDRYHQFFDQQKALLNTVPLQYIASMLGMTPETLSRIRKKSIS